MDNNTINELWKLIRKYPSFQIARILLSKNLLNTNHKAFQLSLKLAAAYSGDREMLKFFLDEEFISEKIVSKTNKKENIIIEEEAIEEFETINNVESFNDSIIDTNSEILKTNDIDAKNSDKNNDEKLSILIDKIRFKLLKAKPDIEYNAINSIKEENDDKFEKRNTNKQLIDQFISDEPTIQPQKKSFFRPYNKAKQSSLEPDDIVTEALAKIYENQGYFSKSIEIYQKLMLLYPKKSIYFANRISEIENKQNQI